MSELNIVHYTYVLLSEKTKRTYTGCAEDVDRRLAAHNQGKVSATRHGRPWILFWVEKHDNYLLARRRESYLKAGAGRRFLKKLFAERCQSG